MYRQYVRLIIIDKPLFVSEMEGTTSSELGIRLETNLAYGWGLNSAPVSDCSKALRSMRTVELYLNKELGVEQARGRIKGSTARTGIHVPGDCNRVAVARPVRWMISFRRDVLTRLEEQLLRQR